ncbi:hypothetical protein VNO77_40017 [Canavalia gladiata]|uniref:Uncharacterized protein n=1 Tax=Canavalia gladiata TaxID=3824 RepID=A0AAN9PRC3_CANGL
MGQALDRSCCRTRPLVYGGNGCVPFHTALTLIMVFHLLCSRNHAKPSTVDSTISKVSGVHFMSITNFS